MRIVNGMSPHSADKARKSSSEGSSFPAGNLNVFKQFVFGLEIEGGVSESVDIFLLGEFGGEIYGRVGADVGLEVGMCIGGNADFDLAFKPTITVPESYPYEFPIRLTVNEGLRPDSYFTTTFPPLGKAYADFIFDFGFE